MIVTGYLRQRCLWYARGDADEWGNPVSVAPVEIPCRWVAKRGWSQGVMGPSTSDGAYRHEILVDHPVREGDSMGYDGETHVVLAVDAIIDAAGQEQGRVCYA